MNERFRAMGVWPLVLILPAAVWPGPARAVDPATAPVTLTEPRVSFAASPVALRAGHPEPPAAGRSFAEKPRMRCLRPSAESGRCLRFLGRPRSAR